MYYDTNKATMMNECTLSAGFLMAMAVRQSNTDGIAQCGMSTATTPKATGCRHRATTHSVLPQAARATANKTTTNRCTKKTGHFDGHGGAPVQYHAY
jgi:hypothetical protein